MQISYHYRSSFDIPSHRVAHLANDPGNSSLVVDAFSDPTRGVDFHHKTVYTVLFLDGHTQLHKDPTFKIRDLAGGSLAIRVRRGTTARDWTTLRSLC